MENVLDLHEEAPDPTRPRVCLDEIPVQLVSEVAPPTLPHPGTPAREDYEYEREGTCNLFVVFCPEGRWRHVEVTAQRTKVDFARLLQQLVDVHFPAATVLRLVMENLNTHVPSALYEAFAPEEANRLLKKLEWHYTPKHGSWLNMVEIENSVLSRQCLDRRIPDMATLRRAVVAWAAERNTANATIEWRFTSRNARITLKRLYPRHSA